MQKKKLLNIILGLAIVVCMLCLLMKSFLAIHTYPEYKGDGVNLMFKLNPLGENFVCEDRYDADIESPLHICKDEFTFIGQDILESIFKIPLPVYLFLLLLLVAIYLKMKNPIRKKWQLAVPVIVIPLSIWIIWLYQTYEPRDKVYSVDNQYSYYLAKYNYNKILEYHPFFFYDGASYEYKAYLYDEVEQKMLISGSVGDINWNDFYGFDHVNNEFGFDCYNSYKLPRPIDKKAIEREKEKRDSIRMVQQYYELPFVYIVHIQPVIQKWADFHKVDLSQVRCYFDGTISSDDYRYSECTPERNSRDLVEMIYSPDKQHYIDIGIRYKIVNGKKYVDDDQADSWQEVSYTNLKLKKLIVLSNFSSSGGADAVFWKNSDTFIVLGCIYDNAYNYHFIDIYTILNRDIKLYRCKIIMEGKGYGSYLNKVIMKEKGINTDNTLLPENARFLRKNNQQSDAIITNSDLL
ncbi:MAG: hypothetical protein LBV74_04600 [Tannerella sp.]|nr:hypothetical protein [Tannerella sp.]